MRPTTSVIGDQDPKHRSGARVDMGQVNNCVCTCTGPLHDRDGPRPQPKAPQDSCECRLGDTRPGFGGRGNLLIKHCS